MVKKLLKSMNKRLNIIPKVMADTLLKIANSKALGDIEEAIFSDEGERSEPVKK